MLQVALPYSAEVKHHLALNIAYANNTAAYYTCHAKLRKPSCGFIELLF